MSTQIRGNKQIKEITITNEQISPNAAIETSKLAEGAELFKRDGSVAATGNINLNSHQLKNIATPVDSTDAVRKIDLENEVAALQSDIDSLDIRVSDLEAHDVVQDGRLDEIDLKDAQQDGRLTAVEGDIVALEGRMDVAEGDIVALEGRMDVAEADIVAIEAKDVEQDSRLSSIETKNTQQDNRLAAVESDITALEAADVAFDTRVSNLEDGLQAETTARIAADNSLDGRLDVAEADIVQLRADLTEATNGVFVTRETPAGAINGVNTVFTLANSPNVGSEQVFINGNLLNPGVGNDYTISDTIITLAIAPEAGDVFLVNYISDGVIFVTGDPGSGGSGATNLNGLTDVTISAPVTDQVLKYNGSQWINATVSFGSGGASYDAVVREIPSGSINGSNSVFVLAQSPLANTEQVFLNGILQQPGAQNDYTISGSTITFNSAPESGWKVLVTYNVAGSGAGGAVTGSISDLSDVAITSPSNGQVLKYNGIGWVNAADNTFSGSYNDLTNKPSLFSGAYADLSGKPSMFSGAYVDLTGAPVLATVATTGSYSDLSNLPVLFSGDYNDLINKPSLFSGAYADLTGVPVLATVATSGSYTDLSDKPALFSGAYVDLTGAPALFSGSYADLTNKPTLFSGSYVDLSNKPTIPSSLDDLSDVVITSALKGQLVVHDGTNFVNTRTIEPNSSTVVPLIIKGASGHAVNLLEVQNISAAVLTSVDQNGTVHTKRYTETVSNAFNTTLAPSAGSLTVDTSLGNAVLGALNASVSTWAFTNVPTENSKATTVTVVIAGNASYTYGDACTVNGSSVSGGVMWSGGTAPTATANTDIITFIIVKDSAGTVKVFGSAITNFS